MYELILKNNATNEFTVHSDIMPAFQGDTYLQFNDIDLDEKDGEYTYALFWAAETGITYQFKAEILSSILTIDGEDYELRDFTPAVGLLRIGDMEMEAKYDNNKQDTYYYE